MDGVTDDPEVCIRRAEEDEATLLSDLALRSKGHWGYDAAFLEACRTELTISTEAIGSLPIFVLERDGRVAGFYGLRKHDDAMELVYLFVEPSEINRGYGKLLWTHAIKTSADSSCRKLLIESDPNAEEFYRTVGARRIGETVSPLDAARVLPLMEFSLKAECLHPNNSG